MTTNLKDFCYEFIEENRCFLENLKYYDTDHSINKNILNEYISKQTCSIKYYSLIQKMLESVKYISCDEIIKILNKNIDEICNLIDCKERKYIPILITTDSYLKKSNVYFTLYFLYNLKKKGKYIDYIYEDIKVILLNSEDPQWIKDNILDYDSNNPPHFLFIICDDITYSGNQISSHFEPKLSYGKDKFKIADNIHIYLNFIAFLPQAIIKIKSVIESKNLIIPKNSIQINKNDSCSSVNQFIKNNNINKKLYDSYIIIKDGNKYSLVSQLDNYLYNPKASLVYPFYKYPDHVSTFTNICFVKNMNSNIKVLNVDNFNKYFEIDDNSFIENFNDDLEVFIINIIKDENKVKNIIYQISEYWDENICRISWIDKCKNVICDDNIKLINNGEYKNFNKYNDVSKCYYVIKSFYHNINYKYKNIEIDRLDNFSDILNNNTKKNYYNKYIKYKNKYFKYKK